MVLAAVSELVLIGCVLTCRQVTFSRIVLIGHIAHVRYRGMSGSHTIAKIYMLKKFLTFSAYALGEQLPCKERAAILDSGVAAVTSFTPRQLGWTQPASLEISQCWSSWDRKWNE